MIHAVGCGASANAHLARLSNITWPYRTQSSAMRDTCDICAVGSDERGSLRLHVRSILHTSSIHAVKIDAEQDRSLRTKVKLEYACRVAIALRSAK